MYRSVSSLGSSLQGIQRVITRLLCNHCIFLSCDIVITLYLGGMTLAYYLGIFIGYCHVLNAATLIFILFYFFLKIFPTSFAAYLASFLYTPRISSFINT